MDADKKPELIKKKSEIGKWREREMIEYTECHDCGYKNTTSSDDCHSCGSLNTTKEICTIEEWENEY